MIDIWLCSDRPEAVGSADVDIMGSSPRDECDHGPSTNDGGGQACTLTDIVDSDSAASLLDTGSGVRQGVCFLRAIGNCFRGRRCQSIWCETEREDALAFVTSPSSRLCVSHEGSGLRSEAAFDEDPDLIRSILRIDILILAEWVDWLAAADTLCAKISAIAV